jgi:flagellar biosynthesis chaperone FliJ
MYNKEEMLNKLKLGLPITSNQLTIIINWLAETIQQQEIEIKSLKEQYDKLSNSWRGSGSSTRETIQTSSVQSKSK